MARLATHKYWVPKMMYSRGEKEGKWYKADSFKRELLLHQQIVSSIDRSSSVRLSFQPLS